MSNSAVAYIAYGVVLVDEDNEEELNSTEYERITEALEEELNLLGLEVLNYSSFDETLLILAIKSSTKKSSGGYPVNFCNDDMRLIENDESKHKISVALYNYDLKAKGDPNWILFSFYG